MGRVFVLTRNVTVLQLKNVLPSLHLYDIEIKEKQDLSEDFLP